MPFQYTENISAFADQVFAILFDIYSGKEVSRGIHLILDHLTPYAKRVLEAVALIPLGFVTSYGSIANVAGGSPRSVGNILASNPFPLIIPCHRVVASNLSLGGYGLGLKVKCDILRREKRGYVESLEIKSKNGRLRFFPVELVLNKLREKC
jgi:O-6-methylguanine DNA methyltransferase